MFPQLIALLLLAAAAPLALADGPGSAHCIGTIHPIPSASDPDKDAFYVNVRTAGTDTHVSGVFVYQESNLIDELQRGGPSLITALGPDPCTDDPLVQPDKLLN